MFNYSVEIEPKQQVGHPFLRKTGIILNMIVKNESPVIERCLRSVAPIIDYFVIVDTGSTDDTPEKIKHLATTLNLSGKLYFRKWVNFGFNRQEALTLAQETKRGDWVFFIDADEELVFTDPLFYQKMEIGVSYQLEKRYNSLNYFLTNLIDIHYNTWEWKSPVHEYLQHSSGPGNKQKLISTWIKVYPGQGNRSKQIDKYQRDVQLLEDELEKDPLNSRNQFYLAQSYRDAEDIDSAIEHYLKRVEMGGWVEEVYVSLCEATRLREDRKFPTFTFSEVLNDYLKAYSICPTRAEALYLLTSFCRRNNQYAYGYLFAKMGLTIPKPTKEILFIQDDVYSWKLLDEFSICAYYIGCFKESKTASERLLKENVFPTFHKERIEKNLEFSKTRSA